MAQEADRLARLMELGLNEYQSRAYLALLGGGRLDATLLSEASGVPRTRIYETCRALHEKGLVEMSADRPIRYAARPIEGYLEQQVAERRREAEGLASRIPEAAKMFRPIAEVSGPKTPPKLHTVQGGARIEAKLQEMLDAARVSVTAKACPVTFPWLMSYFAKRRKRPQLDVAVTAHLREAHLDRVPRGGAVTVRHAREPVAATTLIVDGREALEIYRADPEASTDRDLALWTSHPELVTHWAQNVRNAWALSVSFERRRTEIETGESPERFFHVVRGDEETREMARRLRAEKPPSALSFWVPPDAAGDLLSYEELWSRIRPRIITHVDERTLPLLRPYMEKAEIRHSDLVMEHLVSVTDRMVFLTFYARFGGRLSTDTVIASESPRFVQSQRDLFERVWSQALPLEEFIESLEEGKAMGQVRILRSRREIRDAGRAFADGVESSLIAFLPPVPFHRIAKEAARVKALRARGVKVRYLCRVDEETVADARALAEAGAEVRHYPSRTPMVYAVADNARSLVVYYHGREGKDDAGRVPSLALVADDPRLVENDLANLEDLWAQAEPLEQRLLHVAAGQPGGEIRILRAPEAIWGNLRSFARSVEKEVVAFIPGPLMRALATNGVLELKERGARIRCICNVNHRTIESAKALAAAGAEVRHYASPQRVLSVIADGRARTAVFFREDEEGHPVPTLAMPSDDPQLVENDLEGLERVWEQAQPLSERLSDLADVGAADTVPVTTSTGGTRPSRGPGRGGPGSPTGSRGT